MLSGVSKSGSPAPKSTTSAPAARRASAACIAASVEDDCIRETFLETGNGEVTGKVFIGQFSNEEDTWRGEVQPSSFCTSFLCGFVLARSSASDCIARSQLPTAIGLLNCPSV